MALTLGGAYQIERNHRWLGALPAARPRPAATRWPSEAEADAEPGRPCAQRDSRHSFTCWSYRSARVIIVSGRQTPLLHGCRRGLFQ